VSSQTFKKEKEMKLFNVISATAFLLYPGFSNASDSTASSDKFSDQVEWSEGVILRVEVNADGEENGNTAQMRMDVGEVPSGSNIIDAWDHALKIDDQPVVAEEDFNNGLSTRGWNPYRNDRWYRPYYYNNIYRPYYYNYNYRYNYYRPYYNDYNNYRYYYYPRDNYGYPYYN
jgi:hypothetical protein